MTTPTPTPISTPTTHTHARTRPVIQVQMDDTVNTVNTESTESPVSNIESQSSTLGQSFIQSIIYHRSRITHITYPPTCELCGCAVICCANQFQRVVETPLDVNDVPYALSSLQPAPLPPTNIVDVESPRTTTRTTATTEQHSPTNTNTNTSINTKTSFLGSFFSTLSSSVGWSTPATRSVAGSSRQTPSILSPSQAFPGAFPVSPPPLIEQSLGLQTEMEDERMYPDFRSIGSSHLHLHRGPLILTCY